MAETNALVTCELKSQIKFKTVVPHFITDGSSTQEDQQTEFMA
jgi:hypothetical protein